MTMTKSEFEWAWSALLAVYFIGFATGSILSAGIADRIGRKWTLFLGTCGSLLSAIIALFSIILKMSLMFGFSRLIMSLSAAISMNGLILLFQESSPNHMKGLISFNAEMAFVVTNLVGGLFGMQSVMGQNIVGLIAISIVPSAIACFLSVFLKESPKYLFLKKNDALRAGRALKFYQNIRDEEEKLNVLNDLKLEREEMQNQRNGSVFDILSNQPVRRGFLLGFATMQLTVSVWPVIFYSTDFLMDAGFSYELSESVSTGMLFLSTLSTVAGMFIVERFSRKWLLIGTAVVNIAAILGFSLSAILSHYSKTVSYGCIIFLILHGASYSVAMGPIAWFITSELVPINFRATAQSLVLGLNHTVALVIAFLTFPLYKTIGPVTLVLFFVIPGAVCILMLILYLPETKDKHINEIVEQLKDAKSRRKHPQGAEESYGMNKTG
uniref:MFS domain-containing protein n=1 Tax=Caenorhabditis tropicalis TaxID=1561998 RepID=A0A1I7TWE4_9PELO